MIMHVALLMGGPASGKSTQGNLLAQKGYNVVVSSAVLTAYYNKLAQGDRDREEVFAAMQKGEYVRDSLVIPIVLNHLERLRTEFAQNVVLDGFPRTIPQAMALDGYLSGSNSKVERAICIHLTPDQRKQFSSLRNRTDDQENVLITRVALHDTGILPLLRKYGSVSKVINGYRPDELVHANILLHLYTAREL